MYDPGMNPSKIGDANMDKPNPEKDDEKIFIFQEFLLDQNITVQQLLSDTDTEIIDFARYEIGEPEEEQKKWRNLKLVDSFICYWIEYVLFIWNKKKSVATF